MGQYEQYKELALELLKVGHSSDQAAELILKNKEGKISTFARQIRKWRSKQKKIKNVKILLFDIETAPMICYAWSKYQTPISDGQIVQDWFIISWSAKWLFDDKVFNMAVTPKEAKEANDRRVVEGLWQALHDADIVIAHNLKKFDKKKAQTRFLKYRLGMPSHYREIDTLLTARKEFKISSNRLDYLAEWLGFEGKLDTPKGLWNDCMKGDQQALKDMVKYCDQDVRVLEDVYLELRPWITNHPNINLFTGSLESCKACGSQDLKPHGEYTTTVHIYEAFKCGDCGSVHRSRKNSTPKELRDGLLR